MRVKAYINTTVCFYNDTPNSHRIAVLVTRSAPFSLHFEMNLLNIYLQLINLSKEESGLLRSDPGSVQKTFQSRIQNFYNSRLRFTISGGAIMVDHWTEKFAFQENPRKTQAYLAYVCPTLLSG